MAEEVQEFFPMTKCSKWLIARRLQEDLARTVDDRHPTGLTGLSTQ